MLVISQMLSHAIVIHVSRNHEPHKDVMSSNSCKAEKESTKLHKRQTAQYLYIFPYPTINLSSQVLLTYGVD